MTTTKGAKAFSASGVPKRYRWLPKAELLEVLDLWPGMSVVEIGACASDLVLAASEAIGPGRTLAIAIGPEESIQLRDAARHCERLEVIDSPEEATAIPDGSCDRVLMANAWAEFPDAIATLRQAARLLREDGRLIVIDWHADAQWPEAPAGRVGFREMVELLERHSWDIHRHGELGPYSYFLTASVSDEGVQS